MTKEVSAAEFIVAWWQCDSIEAVCERLGIDRRLASNLAAHLRRRGVNLKSMGMRRASRTYRRLEDIGYLIALADTQKCIWEAARIREKVAEASKI